MTRRYIHGLLSVALFMAHATLRSGTSLKIDDIAAGVHQKSTLRMSRFSFERRISPSQIQRWSSIHSNTEPRVVGSVGSSAIE